MKQYDYIIIGAGCAGLSLLMRILDKDSNAKVLLLDKSKKDINDRTWCFWEKGDGYFEDIVYQKWNTLYVAYDGAEQELNMGDYTYKMIRGIDFYNHCFKYIAQSSTVDFEKADVLSVTMNANHCIIKTKTGVIEAEASFIFSSIPSPFKAGTKNIHLLQHFKGWIINTPEQHYNHKAYLMDFRVSQKPGTAFVYSLPLDENRMLVEYTVFSAALLPNNDYDIALKKYLGNILQLNNYTIEHTEFGSIPMTNYKFPFLKNGIYFIGTAGGQTKPSSGYTFSFIQKQSEIIASDLLKSPASLKNNATPLRFRLYDSILLDVLSNNSMSGKAIFSRLFRALPAYQIFRFLDNETFLLEELKILNTMPFKTFLPVAIKLGIKNFKSPE